MSAPAGYRTSDGFEFPGDPSTLVFIIYRNGKSPKEQPIEARSRRWVQRQHKHDFDITYWRAA